MNEPEITKEDRGLSDNVWLRRRRWWRREDNVTALLLLLICVIAMFSGIGLLVCSYAVLVAGT